MTEARGNTLNARGRCGTAYRVHVARLASGQRDEKSVEAEVGELLAAEEQANLHALAGMVKAFLEAPK